MSTNRRKTMTTLTPGTEGLEDLVVEQSLGERGGRPALLRHRRRMANVLLQTIGPNGVVNVAPHDLVLQKQHRMLPRLRNQRGRRLMKAASVGIQKLILRRALDPPRTLPLPSNPPRSPPTKLRGGRRASSGITL